MTSQSPSTSACRQSLGILKVLEAAGLISRGREAQWRPCKLETQALRNVDDWLSRYRRFWTGSFDKMDAYIAELKRKEKRK